MISICTVVKNKLDVVTKFLTSLKKTIYGPCQVILVDNGNTSDVKAYLDLCLKANMVSTIITNERNEGLGKALSQAVDLAVYDYICITDADIEFLTPCWNVKMMELLEYPEVGLVGTSKNTGGTWMTRHKNYLESYVFTGCCTMTHRRIIDHYRSILKSREIELVYKINMLKSITKDEMYLDYLDRLENFIVNCKNYIDPGYFYGVLDFDISIAIRWLNYKLVIAEDIKLNHNDTTVINEDIEWQKERKKLTHDAWNYYRTKWEIFCDFHDWLGKWECYDSLPFNIKFKEGKKEFGENKAND